ncbi:MAG: cupin domain-containing protein [Gemmatimonadota bacterium]|nr:MAG: cupin domain-containing protein [Gemmatimonadota bacterium]
MLERIDLKRVKKELKTAWMPVDLARVNDSAVRCAKIKGEYHWHTHRFSDEFFLVQDGKMVIQTTKGDVSLESGHGVVVPKGLRHRSKSDKGAIALVFELQSTKKEGD